MLHVAMLTLALPCLMRSEHMLTSYGYLSSVARMRGVLYLAFSMLTVAPRLMRYLAVSTQPKSAAMHSGVSCSAVLFLALTLKSPIRKM